MNLVSMCCKARMRMCLSMTCPTQQIQVRCWGTFWLSIRYRPDARVAAVRAAHGLAPQQVMWRQAQLDACMLPGQLLLTQRRGADCALIICLKEVRHLN